MNAASDESRRSPRRLAIQVTVAFLVCWLVAALHWRSIHHAPDIGELMIGGIAMPLLLLISVAGIRAGFTLGHRPVNAATPTSPSATLGAESDADDARRHMPLALLDASVRLPAGMHLDAVIAQAREGKVTGLHPSLQRPDGARVFAGAAVSTWGDDLDTGLHVLEVATHWNDEQRRAMLLAAEAIDALLERHSMTPVTSNDEPSSSATQPFVLHLLLPERWRAEASSLALWLDRHLAHGHWRPGLQAAAVGFAAQPVEALAAIDVLRMELAQAATPSRHIVLACDSLLSQQRIDTAGKSAPLFAHDQPDGQVLGEGACALLLAAASRESSQVPHIHPLATDSRPYTSNNAAQGSGDTVAQLLQQVLAQGMSRNTALADCALVSDADQRSSRRAEIIDVSQQIWPNMDFRSRCQHLGLANGDSGAVLALTTLAVAGAHCLQTGQPTFAVSIGDASARGALLVEAPPSREAS